MKSSRSDVVQLLSTMQFHGFGSFLTYLFVVAFCEPKTFGETNPYLLHFKAERLSFHVTVSYRLIDSAKRKAKSN